MTPDDEMLIAYADGELDPLAAKRVERAIAADPALAATVAAHRALRDRLGAAFPLEPGPDPLEALIRAAPVPLTPPAARADNRGRWMQAAAMAACVALGVAMGTQLDRGPVSTDAKGALIAAGPLAHALDTQLASADGPTRISVSFRKAGGEYCRVFNGGALAGIACRQPDGWALERTSAAGPTEMGVYRQAGSTDAALMASAQDMAASAPLSPEEERKAIAKGWQ